MPLEGGTGPQPREETRDPGRVHSDHRVSRKVRDQSPKQLSGGQFERELVLRQHFTRESEALCEPAGREFESLRARELQQRAVTFPPAPRLGAVETFDVSCR